MQVDGDLIAHRAGGDEERGLEAEAGSGFFLECPHCRVFAIDVVTHLCRRHRLAHRRIGPGHRIGTQINQAHHGFLSPTHRHTPRPGTSR